MKSLVTTLFVLITLANLTPPAFGQAGRTGRGGSSFRSAGSCRTPRTTPMKSPVSYRAGSPAAPRSFSSLAGAGSTGAAASNRAIGQATRHFQTTASRLTTNPGLSYTRQQQAYAKNSGPLRLFKAGAESNQLRSAGAGHSLYLPNKGNPKANWKANSGAIRQEIATGRPIMDSHTRPRGQLIGTKGFLRAERSLLQARGYTYNNQTGTWNRVSK